jgi:hypothetical protein
LKIGFIFNVEYILLYRKLLTYLELLEQEVPDEGAEAGEDEEEDHQVDPEFLFGLLRSDFCQLAEEAEICTGSSLVSEICTKRGK